MQGGVMDAFAPPPLPSPTARKGPLQENFNMMMFSSISDIFKLIRVQIRVNLIYLF